MKGAAEFLETVVSREKALLAAWAADERGG